MRVGETRRGLPGDCQKEKGMHLRVIVPVYIIEHCLEYIELCIL